MSNAKSSKRFELDRKCYFNDRWITKVRKSGPHFAHLRPC